MQVTKLEGQGNCFGVLVLVFRAIKPLLLLIRNELTAESSTAFFGSGLSGIQILTI